MIACICKYSPFAVFDGFSEEGIVIESEINGFKDSEILLHPNMCSYSKVLIDTIIDKNIDKVFLVNCCDSIRRLKDTLEKIPSIKFVYMMDLPRKNNCCAKEILKNEILKFIDEYEKFSLKKFDLDKFNKSLYKYLDSNNLPENKYVSILGARASKDLIQKIEDSLSYPLVNNTCSRKHYLTNIKNFNNKEEAISWYASEILNYTPCMRMEDITNRRALLEDPNLKGIIYNTIKFCDHYSYEYMSLQRGNLPILKIETDLTNQSNGQIKTRIEAFNEQLGGGNIKMKDIKNKDKIYVMGIDSGSTSTNAVVLDKDKNILSSIIVKTGAKSMDSAFKAFDLALEEANLKKEDISLIVGTGYGRYNIPFVDENITEITCHGKGAHFLNPEVRTIIDIGGQDSKAIGIDENGNVKSFVMNDKCAAGTGRFLEMIAKTLEIDLEQMSEEGLSYKEDLTITSVCSVFAESEVVSLIADNKERKDIIHGINKSIATKTVGLVERVSRREKYMMTGGVAKNKGVIKALEERLNSKIFIAEEPQICGALGAAIIGIEKILEN
ncbi:putative CoA-substrate-specific enzyme activase [Clostridium moniliforme]|uniref:CoA-substrate-specific enzyme activase n=1 Tax=Clostridium moniliforme TaxID=39489 RepID=A0ABS4EXG9_9CLOT|nr:acyl-CoA dehydratase activase [Clostridium moniliforme]MBP1888699.1 putative CoA-substrate-specific enzyme activase [Clostridium moniliforme]